MEVAEHKAEDRKFSDGVIEACAFGGNAVYDASAAEPPPEILREDASRHWRGVQPLDCHPVPEPLSGPAPDADKFQSSGKIAGQEYQSRGCCAGGKGGAESAAGKADQVVDQPEGDGSGQRGDGGDAQVVGRGRGGPTQFGLEGHYDVAEIVVADGVAGKPQVFRRKVPGLVGRIQEHEVHRFFGVGNGRGAGHHESPQGEQPNKNQFGGQQDGPIMPQELTQFLPTPAIQPKGTGCGDKENSPDG